ncbi:MAG: aminopeptidase N [Alphaproteobacteria bacterium]|nr:aminopeptidase N [Alphaproteobacteria bacterium]
MKTDQPVAIRREDYRPAPYRVVRTALEFLLEPAATRVHATLDIEPNQDRPGALELHGEHLKLVDIKIEGRPLAKDAYAVTDDKLIIKAPPATRFRLDTTVEINPLANTALSGLYISDNMFCTQCEAEGFRRITYSLDRPDNMSVYSVRMVADRAHYPVLLSNGNEVARGTLPGGRHFAEWQDPFPKPSYLFALVAGDLAHVEDHFTTMSGRRVKLGIYVTHGNEDKVSFAMGALKRCMKWDEDAYGREYDLDVFNIVAVSAFNFGAMENKGLNIFNDKLILARPDTATDTDYDLIEAVVGHEYFHNWSGNRITCRDWFQLSLKEGFTVFRDQSFSADMRSAAVERIGDVRALRSRQFQEDGGPLAHPVRPDAYVTIDNFYTATVYEKGAELCRMVRTILGPEAFRKGSDLYFARHDGTAATCDDFIKAMEDSSGVDLAQFKLWYAQAGTPQVKAHGTYDAASKSYALTLEQNLTAAPGQSATAPMHIPVAVGLVGRNSGRDLKIALDGGAAAETLVLNLRQGKQTFKLTGVSEVPVPSIGRGFSAPVRFAMELSGEDRAFLMAKDSDSFNRWESGQKLATELLVRMTNEARAGKAPKVDQLFVDAFGELLRDARKDPAFTAMAVQLPTEMELAQIIDDADPDAIHVARETLRKSLAATHGGAFRDIYQSLKSNEPYSPDAAPSGRRALRNMCLRYLTADDTAATRALAFEQFRSADNMTDQAGGLAPLTDMSGEERDTALKQFYERWKNNPLVIDKWMSLQAMSSRPDTLSHIESLTKHPAFNIENPNRVRALVGAFVMNNQLRFHAADGAGYRFLADRVLQLDGLNPQVAARLCGAFETWRRFDGKRQTLMREQLMRIKNAPGLSRNVAEITEKTLG